MAPKPRQKRLPSGPAKPEDAQPMLSALQQPPPNTVTTAVGTGKDQQPAASTSIQAASTAITSSSAAMPPPPQPPNKPQAILEPEMTALAECLKNAVVKTAQVYAFHADAHRLGLQRHMPYPPRSLIASLGSEVERYDQLCDAIEFQISRAISVLQRDLSREHARIREAENAIAQRTRSKSPSKSPLSSRVSLPPSDSTDVTMQPSTGRDQSPASSTALSSAPARRQSNISLSSLQRPPLPLKLDLSAARMNPDDTVNFAKSGLASPVALAPKSARLTSTTEIDLMAAFANAANQADQRRHIDIDLTSSPVNMHDDVDLSLGTSADKPIELDLDNIDIEMSSMTDLFGDESNDAQGGDSLFSPAVTEIPMALPAAHASNDTKDLDMGIIDALSAVDASGHSGNPLDALHNPHDGGHPASGSGQSHPAPSPGTLLEGLGNIEGGKPPTDSGIDFSSLDFSGLSPDLFMNQMNQHGPDMSTFDMDSFLQNMSQASSSNDAQKPDS